MCVHIYKYEMITPYQHMKFKHNLIYLCRSTDLVPILTTCCLDKNKELHTCFLPLRTSEAPPSSKYWIFIWSTSPSENVLCSSNCPRLRAKRIYTDSESLLQWCWHATLTDLETSTLPTVSPVPTTWCHCHAIGSEMTQRSQKTVKASHEADTCNSSDWFRRLGAFWCHERSRFSFIYSFLALMRSPMLVECGRVLGVVMARDSEDMFPWVSDRCLCLSSHGYQQPGLWGLRLFKLLLLEHRRRPGVQWWRTVLRLVRGWRARAHHQNLPDVRLLRHLHAGCGREWPRHHHLCHLPLHVSAIHDRHLPAPPCAGWPSVAPHASFTGRWHSPGLDPPRVFVQSHACLLCCEHVQRAATAGVHQCRSLPGGGACSGHAASAEVDI